MNAGAEWTRYRGMPELGSEAMHARFVRHAYHRHSHETYSFGVTESGTQAFRCRGADHVSKAGLVMVFNPEDPHDGHAGASDGFVYRMVHLDPAVIGEVLAHSDASRRGLPLFADPVRDDSMLAAAVRRASRALLDGDDPLAATEAVNRLVLTAARGQAFDAPPRTCPAGTAAVAWVRDRLHDDYASPLTADDLARTAGLSRFQVYRLFRHRYGLAPSTYLRQQRLRAARRALAAGRPVTEVAVGTGFADQAHLTRWFRRTYGITPAAYASALTRPGSPGTT